MRQIAKQGLMVTGTQVELKLLAWWTLGCREKVKIKGSWECLVGGAVTLFQWISSTNPFFPVRSIHTLWMRLDTERLHRIVSKQHATSLH